MLEKRAWGDGAEVEPRQRRKRSTDFNPVLRTNWRQRECIGGCNTTGHPSGINSTILRSHSGSQRNFRNPVTCRRHSFIAW